MATVTGLTAERMLEIEAASIISGEVIDGDLILTKHDGTTIDAGPVIGPQGPQGIQGEAGDAVPTINAQTGTSYTLVLGDQDNIVECSNANPITLTVPPESSVNFGQRHFITVIQTGVGQVTIAPGAGVTINATPGLKIAARWGSVTLLKRGTDLWIAMGNLSP